MKESNTVNPAVTVLLSCYNGSRWLDEAIKSVLNQTFVNFEFIIIDDGSTDDSLEIIRRYGAKDPRIVIISKNNTGLADSLNAGIQQAHGEWIARLDADDICEPSRLEKQLAKARENPYFIYIGSDFLMIDENGNAVTTYHYSNSHEQLVRNLHTSHKFPPHSSAFYRTDIVRSIGGYRRRIRRAQDLDLWLRLSEVGKLTVINEPLVKIRKHHEQISHDESGRRQKIDSRVSIVSYWLRHHGCADPVGGNDEVFASFREWVANRLEQERYFEFFDHITDLKAKVLDAYQSPSAFLSVAKFLTRRPVFLIRFLRLRLFGDMTARRLAVEWMEKSNMSTDS